MKKFLSILLVVSILSSISMPAFAASNAPSREEYNDLIDAVRAAKTDEDAIIAMDNLLNFYERVDSLQNGSDDDISLMNTDLYPGAVEAYIKVNSCTINSHSITVTYEVLALVPSLASLTFGYEYPASTRMTGGVITPGGIGTHTQTIETSGTGCQVQVVGKFLARDFRATKVYKTGYQYPFSGSQYSYHTVTQSEVNANKIALLIAGITSMLSFESKIGKFVVYVAGTMGILSIFNDMPSLSAGQYYVTEVHFSNGYMYSTLKIWNSQNAYRNNEECLYSRTQSTRLPSFP